MVGASMITLYTFGPYFGLPDGSPFVVKAMLLLKFAGLHFQEDRRGYRKAPKGKLPYIDDDGVLIADSTFIRFHIEEKYRFDFDGALSDRDKAISWAVEKMCEDHLYWAILDARWGDNANFLKGPARFFDSIPAPVRPLITRIIRNKTLKSVRAHGLGRHTRAEIEGLAARDLSSLSVLLGDKAYLMGDTPCAADASVFGFVSGALASVFDTPIRLAAESYTNLTAYSQRLSTQYFAPVTGG
jgi:glutathione S-transferase